jgi:hypothetical protein
MPGGRLPELPPDWNGALGITDFLPVLHVGESPDIALQNHPESKSRVRGNLLIPRMIRMHT